ncbi:hypothetical protein EAG_16307 [Camponotus floridanus]|uniref:Uncharacterized protein n=1 Tax=Camponotus floridanus TaxID=104421 RepID=E2A6J4_CAMFO|nr:hypothetical protein EAG_16307 [Camponotus floridanus]
MAALRNSFMHSSIVSVPKDEIMVVGPISVESKDIGQTNFRRTSILVRPKSSVVSLVLGCQLCTILGQNQHHAVNTESSKRTKALEHRCDSTPFNLRSIIRPDLHRLIAQAVSHTADRNNEPQMPAIARKGEPSFGLSTISSLINPISMTEYSVVFDDA